MLSLAEVGEAALADWKADVDLGDHVAVEGPGHQQQAR
jgi:lysyl-tRNA synthetase class 2